MDEALAPLHGPPALLSIGLKSGGTTPRNREVEDALGEFQRKVIRERQRYENEGLRINIIFMIPGRFFSPDFEGVRATRLDRRNQHLLIAAAVPRDLRQDVNAYLAGVLRTALNESTAYLHRKKLSVDTNRVTQLITDLLTELEPPPD